MDLKKISELLANDSIIEQLNNGETLTIEELIALKNSIEKKIMAHLLSK